MKILDILSKTKRSVARLDDNGDGIISHKFRFDGGFHLTTRSNPSGGR